MSKKQKATIGIVKKKSTTLPRSIKDDYPELDGLRKNLKAGKGVPLGLDLTKLLEEIQNLFERISKLEAKKRANAIAVNISEIQKLVKTVDVFKKSISGFEVVVKTLEVGKVVDSIGGGAKRPLDIPKPQVKSIGSKKSNR